MRNLSKKSTPQNGLQNNTIALWASHGWYFEQRQDEWVWQRPRMFHVAEDTYTLGYVLPYLAPMLENAGAYVLMPRERDTQLHEKIVDNDDDAFPYYEEIPDAKNDWQQGDTTGFGHRKEMYVSGENPFCFGTYRQIKAKKDGIAAINWTPDIPEDGEYSVYVSYHSLPNSTSDARYTVYHTGGFTEFSVNQKMGGSMWVYLGSFHFRKGVNPETGRVVLTNHGKSNTIVSADAVRFGGGYGLIGRSVSEDEEPTTGLKPKYLEGARYWLQWAGFPDSVYARNENHDYKDDYMSRGHWVNALIGGSTLAPDTDGKKIPISLAMGFHTDAGQVFKDSVIGTMSIYMSQSNNSKSFTNGQRRIVSRDLADIVQTEIVSDARRMFRENWTRRKLTDASYYEARVPEVPTFLLELLSHQNYTDMTYGLDPNFQFHICRSIYKGILKFLAFQQDRDYIVQPLPVCNFNIQFFNDERNVLLLNWSPTEDSLETTAKADHYLLYTSVDDNGWNNGEIIQGTSARITLLPDKLYRFKITAVNKGLQSFKGVVLFTSHDHEFISTVANRIIVLEKGGIRDVTESYDEYLAERYEI